MSFDVKYYKESQCKRIPIIMSFHSEINNFILLKDIASILGYKTNDLNRRVNNNLNKFDWEKDIFDIKDIVENNDTLKICLRLTARELNKNVKNIYILNKNAFYVLITNVLKTGFVDEHKIIHMYDINSDMLIKGDLNYLDLKKRNRLIRILKSNKYVKDIYNCLRCSVDINDVIRKKVSRFKGDVENEAMQQICKILNIPNSKYIPEDVYVYLEEYLEEGFVLSEKLEAEYRKIRNEINVEKDIIINFKRSNNENNINNLTQLIIEKYNRI